MAIVNGRKVYDSRKVAAVAAIEDKAASEYVWMMAGVSDDWGRFRANARTILGEAYRDRAGVTEADVERWLGLFNSVLVPGEEHGLLRFYQDVDGVRYAEWTNYMGDPPSQRQHHSCPEPEWSDHVHGPKCRMWRGAKAKPARPTQPPTQLPTQPPTPKEPKKAASDGSNGHASDPPVPPVPSVTPVTATEQAVGRAAPPNPLVDRVKLNAEGSALIPQIAALADLDPTEVLAKASLWRGRSYVRLDAIPDDRLAHTVNSLKSWHRSLTGQAEPALPAARAAPTLTPLTEKLVGTMREIREEESRERATGAGELGDLRGGSARDRLAPPKAS